MTPMTRRWFLSLVACLPLGWQVRLGATPEPLFLQPSDEALRLWDRGIQWLPVSPARETQRARLGADVVDRVMATQGHDCLSERRMTPEYASPILTADHDLVCPLCGWSERATQLNDPGGIPPPHQRWVIHQMLAHDAGLPADVRLIGYSRLDGAFAALRKAAPPVKQA